VDEILLCLCKLIIRLFLQIVGQLNSSLSILFLLLLLGNSQFFISELPELGEFSLLLLFAVVLFDLSVDLILSTLLNGMLHLEPSLFFFFKQICGLVLSFGNLLV
jgi:hypothetical protein